MQTTFTPSMPFVAGSVSVQAWEGAGVALRVVGLGLSSLDYMQTTGFQRVLVCTSLLWHVMSKSTTMWHVASNKTYLFHEPMDKTISGVSGVTTTLV